MEGASPTWVVEPTCDPDGHGLELFAETERRLQLREHLPATDERAESLRAERWSPRFHWARRDPHHPLVWTQASEPGFIAWSAAGTRILWTERRALVTHDGRRLDERSVVAVEAARNLVRLLTAADSTVLLEEESAVDAAWSEALARDLAAWLCVPVRESRDGQTLREHMPGIAVVAPDHYLTRHLKSLRASAPGTFLVLVDEGRRVTHHEAFSLDKAKRYADDVASEAESMPGAVAIVFDRKGCGIYRGRHY